MGAAKPTLGYSSRTAAVMGLRSKGRSTRQIALAINIPAKTVLALEHSAARARRPRPCEQQGRTVVFPIDVLEALQPYADARGTHVNTLARLIVKTAADEFLVDAILDDKELEVE